jgi:catechol 2,3-dioxygenase-like lactoylglutathione lyase family enzyme
MSQNIPLAFRADHLALRVADFTATVDWYIEKLGFHLTQQWTVEGLDGLSFAYLEHGNIRLEIIGGNAPTQFNPAQRTVPDHLGIQGFIHLCLRVDDLDGTLTALRARSVGILAEPFVIPAIGQRLALIQDNNGNVIELAQAVAE